MCSIDDGLNTILQAKKARSFLKGLFLKLNPATSYFPTTESCSIIGSDRLNCRVRDGNGCDPIDIITGKTVGSGRWADGRRFRHEQLPTANGLLPTNRWPAKMSIILISDN